MSQYAISSPGNDSRWASIADSLSSWRFSRGYLITTVLTTILANVVMYGLIIAILPDLLSHLAVYGEQKARLTAMVLAISTGTAALCFPLFGIVADLASTRKWPLIAGLIVFLGATIMFYVAPSVFVFVLSRAVQGACSSLLIASDLALCLDNIESAEVGVIFGLLFGILELGTTFSPSLGGTLYTHGGTFMLMFVSLAMIVVALTMVTVLGEGKLKSKVMPKAEPGSEGTSPFEEQRPLLEEVRRPDEPSHDDIKYGLQPSTNIFIQQMPILQCLKDKSFIGALGICAAQSSLAGAFDATLPLEANRLFGFTPEQVGYLFIPLGVAKFTFSQIGGRAVDRFGPRQVAMLCYLLLIPVLLMFYLLRPTPRTPQIVLICTLLMFCAVSKIKPHIFGNRNPSAALCGLNMMVWSMGYTGGSLLAGNLRLAIGYGNTMAIFAGFSFLGFVGSYICLDKRMPANVIIPSNVDVTAS